MSEFSINFNIVMIINYSNIQFFYFFLFLTFFEFSLIKKIIYPIFKKR